MQSYQNANKILNIDNIILKFIWKGKGTQTAKRILKKEGEKSIYMI